MTQHFHRKPTLRHAGRSREAQMAASARDNEGPHSPLGVEDAEEGGPTPVLARQGEDGLQVVEGDVALGEAALQPRFLEGGPLFLQSPGAAQVSLRKDGSGHYTQEHAFKQERL